jgi:hypothetical protein
MRKFINVDQARSVMFITIRLRGDLIQVEGAESKGQERLVKNDMMTNNLTKHNETNKVIPIEKIRCNNRP